MNPISQNLIHDLGDKSAARIGKVRRDEKASYVTDLPHPSGIVKKSKGKISDDELSLCCVNYLHHIGKELCHNPDTGKATKCSCLMELVEDDSASSLAAILLRVHSKKDEGVQKELIHEWERSAAVRFLFEHNRKKRKNEKKKFKGERKRGRIYALSGVYRDDGTV